MNTDIRDQSERERLEEDKKKTKKNTSITVKRLASHCYERMTQQRGGGQLQACLLMRAVITPRGSNLLNSDRWSQCIYMGYRMKKGK